MKTQRKPAPDKWWTDPATGERLGQLTWREWNECLALFLKGAKLGLHKPGLSGRKDAANR